LADAAARPAARDRRRSGGRDRRALRPVVEAEVTPHVRAAALLRRAADVAPAMGLVGTLVGLVQMLGSLDRPDAIGPAMAVALLTTLYGAAIAHMLLLPLAERVAGFCARLVGCRELEADLARAIAAGENPRRLRDRLAPVRAVAEASASARPRRPGVPAGEVP
jgi:chemotaxis protein MotA